VELTREEEAMLRGDKGEGVAKAMKIVVKVGEVLGAARLVPITHAHASGVSYATIGRPGLHWLESLASGGARASVYATINPIGFDLESNIIKVDSDFVKGQIKILDAFRKMGFETSLTCTPYYLRRPKPMERLAWGESSAVMYANSVLGAFTNREGGPLAVASAITGRTYEAGLQLLENRATTHIVEIDFEPSDPAEWSAVGYVLGEKVEKGVPRLPNAKTKLENLKYMLAASAASGGLAMAVVEGVTPEGTYLRGSEEKVSIERKDVDGLFGSVDDADVVFHGCPHVSESELEALNNMIKHKLRRDLWIAVAPELYKKNRDLVKALARKGVRFVRGTCAVVAPLEKSGVKRIATTSAKTYFYLKKKGFDVWLVRLKEVVEA